MFPLYQQNHEFIAFKQGGNEEKYLQTVLENTNKLFDLLGINRGIIKDLLFIGFLLN